MQRKNIYKSRRSGCFWFGLPDVSSSLLCNSFLHNLILIICAKSSPCSGKLKEACILDLDDVTTLQLRVNYAGNIHLFYFCSFVCGNKKRHRLCQFAFFMDGRLDRLVSPSLWSWLKYLNYWMYWPLTIKPCLIKVPKVTFTSYIIDFSATSVKAAACHQHLYLDLA